MPESIDITPNFNLERIQAYADRNMTRDPQTHLTSQLEVWAELSDILDEDGVTFGALSAHIARRHREASGELMSWFGGPAYAGQDE